MSTSISDASGHVVAGDAFVTPDQASTERAENLARIVRVFSGELGLSGHLTAWAEGQGAAPVLADIETLSSTLDQLRDLVTGGAA